MVGNAPRLLTYRVGNSVLHRLDPRTKLVGTMVIVAGVLLAGNPPAISVAYALGAVAGAFAFHLLSALWRALRPLVVLIFLFGLIIVVITPGHALIHIFILVPTRDGVELAVRLGLQALLIVYTTSLLTLTTPPLALADGLEWLTGFLRKVHFPVHDVIAMVGIGLTFVPLLIEEVQKVISAQRARGANLGINSLLEEDSMGALMIPLLLANLRRGEELAASMDSRLYGTGTRGSLYERHFRRIDGLAGVILATGLAIIVYLSFFTSTGATGKTVHRPEHPVRTAIPAMFRTDGTLAGRQRMRDHSSTLHTQAGRPRLKKSPRLLVRGRHSSIARSSPSMSQNAACGRPASACVAHP